MHACVDQSSRATLPVESTDRTFGSGNVPGNDCVKRLAKTGQYRMENTNTSPKFELKCTFYINKQEYRFCARLAEPIREFIHRHLAETVGIHDLTTGPIKTSI